jgi:hypothetical protein
MAGVIRRANGLVGPEISRQALIRAQETTDGSPDCESNPYRLFFV